MIEAELDFARVSRGKGEFLGLVDKKVILENIKAVPQIKRVRFRLSALIGADDSAIFG